MTKADECSKKISINQCSLEKIEEKKGIAKVFNVDC
jgi:hypothetical protein